MFGACGETIDSTSVTDSDSSAENQDTLEEWAGLWCGVAQACSCQGFSEEVCRVNLETTFREWEEQAAKNSLSVSMSCVEQQTRVFEEAGCVDEELLGVIGCVDRETAPCSLFVGSGKKGEECARFWGYADTCSDGLRCRYGVCDLPCASPAPVPVGELCLDGELEYGPCEEGAYCATDGRCLPRPGEAELCPDDVCVDGYYCDEMLCSEKIYCGR